MQYSDKVPTSMGFILKGAFIDKKKDWLTVCCVSCKFGWRQLKLHEKCLKLKSARRREKTLIRTKRVPFLVYVFCTCILNSFLYLPYLWDQALDLPHGGDPHWRGVEPGTQFCIQYFYNLLCPRRRHFEVSSWIMLPSSLLVAILFLFAWKKVVLITPKSYHKM